MAFHRVPAKSRSALFEWRFGLVVFQHIGTCQLSVASDQGTGISSQRKYNPQRADSAIIFALLFYQSPLLL